MREIKLLFSQGRSFLLVPRPVSLSPAMCGECGTSGRPRGLQTKPRTGTENLKKKILSLCEFRPNTAFYYRKKMDIWDNSLYTNGNIYAFEILLMFLVHSMYIPFQVYMFCPNCLIDPSLTKVMTNYFASRWYTLYRYRSRTTFTFMNIFIIKPYTGSSSITARHCVHIHIENCTWISGLFANTCYLNLSNSCFIILL